MINNTLAEQHNQRMWAIRAKALDLIEYGCGNLTWIAPQQNEHREYYGVAWVQENVFEREGYVDIFIPKQDFEAKTDNELAAQAAETILGYPVGSPQDIERRKRYAKQHMERITEEIKKLNDERRNWKLLYWSLGGE